MSGTNYFEFYKILQGYMFDAISRIHGRSIGNYKEPWYKTI